MSTVAHFFHSSFSICLVFLVLLLIFLLTQGRKTHTMFSKSQRRLLRKVVTSFHKSFKWISWKRKKIRNENPTSFLHRVSEWFSIHQSQYLCYIQYEPRKIQIKLQKMEQKQQQNQDTTKPILHEAKAKWKNWDSEKKHCVNIKEKKANI